MSCAAYGCTNRASRKVPGITFHRFPKDQKRRDEWVWALKRKNFIPSEFSRVCSKHFEEEMFDRTSHYVVLLKHNAVPTIFEAFPSYLKKLSKKSCFKEKISISEEKKRNSEEKKRNSEEKKSNSEEKKRISEESESNSEEKNGQLKRLQSQKITKVICSPNLQFFDSSNPSDDQPSEKTIEESASPVKEQCSPSKTQEADSSEQRRPRKKRKPDIRKQCFPEIDCNEIISQPPRTFEEHIQWSIRVDCCDSLGKYIAQELKKIVLEEDIFIETKNAIHGIITDSLKKVRMRRK